MLTLMRLLLVGATDLASMQILMIGQLLLRLAFFRLFSQTVS